MVPQTSLFCFSALFYSLKPQGNYVWSYMTQTSLLNYNVLRSNRQWHSEILSLVVAFFSLERPGGKTKNWYRKKRKGKKFPKIQRYAKKLIETSVGGEIDNATPGIWRDSSSDESDIDQPIRSNETGFTRLHVWWREQVLRSRIQTEISGHVYFNPLQYTRWRGRWDTYNFCQVCMCSV